MIFPAILTTNDSRIGLTTEALSCSVECIITINYLIID